MKKTLLLASLWLGLGGSLAQADEAPIQAADTKPASVDELDQRVRILERQLEIQKEDASAKGAAAVNATLDKDGFVLKSADGQFRFSAKTLVQADTRSYIDDIKIPQSNTFTIRRARLYLDGTIFGNTDFRITPDFGGGTTVLQDAYVNIGFLDSVKLKAGKFTSPLSLARIQPAPAQRFNEFGFAADLAPNRDLGFDLNGYVLNKNLLTYDAGIFAGAGDGASIDAPPAQDDRDFVGRIFTQPFNSTDISLLQKLGLGVAVSYGNRSITAAVNPASIKSIGQNSLFSYATGVTESGGTSRIDPQAWWYWNNYGLLGEWISSSQYLTKAGLKSPELVSNQAFEIQANWAITGEDESYGQIKPHANWDPAHGTFGALELDARYGAFRADPASYKAGVAFVDPIKSPIKAENWGLALNWLLNPNVTLIADWEQTWYQGGGGGTAAHPLDREKEQVAFTRIQLSY